MLLLLLLLLSCFSRVRLCATPETAAHKAPPSLGFSRQEHWSGLPFPSPVHESEKWKWSRSVVSNSSWPHGLQPTRLRRPWDFWEIKVSNQQHLFLSVQFSSIARSCPTLYTSMECSTPGFPVHHQLPELTQTHVHRTGDAIKPSHPLLSPSPPTFNLSQHQGLFKWVSSSH